MKFPALSLCKFDDTVGGPDENTGSNYPGDCHRNPPMEHVEDKNEGISCRYLRPALFPGVAYLTDFLFRVLVNPGSCSGIADITPAEVSVCLFHVGRVQHPWQSREGQALLCYCLTVALGTNLVRESALVLLFLAELLSILHPLSTAYRTWATPYTIDSTEVVGVYL